MIPQGQVHETAQGEKVYVPTLPEALGMIKSLSETLREALIELSVYKARDAKNLDTLAQYGKKPEPKQKRGIRDYYKRVAGNTATGIVGVTEGKGGSFRARFRNIYLGQFEYIEEAIERRKYAERQFDLGEKITSWKDEQVVH